MRGELRIPLIDDDSAGSELLDAGARALGVLAGPRGEDANRCGSEQINPTLKLKVILTLGTPKVARDLADDRYGCYQARNAATH
jgi:hypothetical protein